VSDSSSTILKRSEVQVNTKLFQSGDARYGGRVTEFFAVHDALFVQLTVQFLFNFRQCINSCSARTGRVQKNNY